MKKKASKYHNDNAIGPVLVTLTAGCNIRLALNHFIARATLTPEEHEEVRACMCTYSNTNSEG